MERFRRESSLGLLLAIAVLAVGASAAIAQSQTPLVATQGQRVYPYPEGQFELQGNGAASDPYYWIWIPKGAQSVPAPPALPVFSAAGQPLAAQNQRVFTYPNGRYELRGDNSANNPYIWVWIPNEVVPVPPALPNAVGMLPGHTGTVQARRVYTYPEGRFELRGNGSTDSPFFWVWIPSGIASVPAPPSLSNLSARSDQAASSAMQRVYTYPDGRYELRGNGTATDPYFWVWEPSGMSAAIVPSVPILPQ
jgi:hypothetical protein